MQVTSCCGCCSLRAGSIIIGIIQIILSIMMVILTYVLNIRWEVFLAGVDPDAAKIIYTIAACITIFTAILLLVGVFERNTFMMLPWLVLGVMGTVSGLINTICTVIVCIVNDNPRGCHASVIGGLTSLLIYWHLWRVVYSHFQQLKNEKMNNYQQQA